jgi:ankyrin repeat protein
MQASELGFFDIVRILVGKGAKADGVSRSGNTPLFVACQKNHLDVTKFLIERRANIDIVSDDGKSPLFAGFRSFSFIPFLHSLKK